ncbi:hypothetical protein LTR10_014231 [Elasticomyces elasticus]|uniref:Oxo-4-hydroxy-4-carboxy-5-ureidoimidazoline decarboxylase domain-containing protein n=1 Tax=Exophiala sideris TaxID=1016849 RepID=A0ABR0JI51_9EURO|nr:hypothetical protein LTR10_014231 [Elasticomyces elasticus]KAK5034272.1 hypothetical protein LTS07_003192 [Exophiala sideris]KAK5042568.1 hypothetical protein LTR13_001415 [Exophiala sideris]KAK5065650.1 hypothetical protein LTR69_003199 [Exophiala sideris]KAK5185892.1 hypothetical protein LTR44_001941 [Eurotiomycetes sp. CCFEE 6388]
MTTLPPISTLPSLDTEERAKVLDLLFEPCQQLHTLSVSLLREKTFSSYDELIDAVGKQLFDLYESNLESDTKWLDAILSAHPRLGEKKVDSEQSRNEQAQLNQGGSEEAQLLADMNRKYEETFPGLRYVVFVNGRSRPVIMADMQKRIERGDISQEKQDAIKVGLDGNVSVALAVNDLKQAMCAIASDRASKLGG